MYARAQLKHILGTTQVGVMPRELLTTNRIMERWAVANGSGMATERWDDNPRRSRVSPLDDDTFLVVERLVNHSPPRTNRLIVGWYMRPLPTRELARELGMEQRSLERGLHVCLNFLKFKFEESNYMPLLKILRVEV